MRLIDADELARHVMEAYTPEECATRCAFPDDFLTRISDMPTIDKWHYPSRGEYPPEELYVLCELLDGTHEVGKYFPNDKEPPWDFGSYLEDYIKCWQYIVPPKEEA